MHRGSRPLLSYSLFDDMKPFLERICKRRKAPLTTTDALASKLRPGPASSTSTMMASTTNPMASVPAGSATTSAQVIRTTGVTVSLRLGPSYRWCCHNYSIVIDQTAQLGVPAHVEEHNPCVSPYSFVLQFFY